MESEEEGDYTEKGMKKVSFFGGFCLLFAH